jgi:hypothetical protein
MRLSPGKTLTAQAGPISGRSGPAMRRIELSTQRLPAIGVWRLREAKPAKLTFLADNARTLAARLE